MPGSNGNDQKAQDDEFPLGDGVAETGVTVVCPHCGESTDIALDPGSGATQSYEEDCAVCCRPWTVRVRYRADGGADVSVEPTD
jgi:hypothetical protein